MFDAINNPMFRSFAWRLGRKLYCWARRDVSNAPETNGEYWLLTSVLSQASSEQAILVDIGANRGDWTTQACKALEDFKRNGSIYALEPTQSTYAFLLNRFKTDDRVKINNVALSDHPGEAEFFVVGELAGKNSLHNGNVQGAITEKVHKQRLDDFLAETGL